jgi:hypothetical protein
MSSDDPRDLYKSIILRNNMGRVYRRDRESTLAKVLAALGESDNALGGLFGARNFYGATDSPWNDQDRSAIDQARDSMFLDTSEGKFLTVLGGNYGVPRPSASPFDDDLYRSVIPILAWLPKTPMLVPYRLAEAIFGTQESLGADAWAFYEVNANEIIFELPGSLITGSNVNASYMHGWPGYATAVGGPTDEITAIGTDARESVENDDLNGRTLWLYHTGAWQEYTITNAAYDAGTLTNTFTLDTADVPTGNSMPMFIDIPEANSFRGDFMLADASEAAGDPNPPSDDLVYLFGRGRLDIFTFYMSDFVRAAGVVLRTEVL